jgi:hypothetical protein
MLGCIEGFRVWHGFGYRLGIEIDFKVDFE